jgi:hypothetical protein
MIHHPFTANRLDPRMVLQPSPAQIGALPPAVPVLRNLYPNLRLQRIGESSMASLSPIPAQWPLLAFKPISIVWPQLQLASAQTIPPSARLAPAK